MTKKLSEIGHTREPEVLIVALQMLEEKHREELLTLLTPAERQDLVRQVFEYAWKEGQCHPNLGIEAELAKFLKENGL